MKSHTKWPRKRKSLIVVTLEVELCIGPVIFVQVGTENPLIIPKQIF